MKIKNYKNYLILLGIALAFVLIFSIWRLFHIPTSAMVPTIPKGSNLISQRYVFSKPQRGDIVIFKTENIQYGGNPLIGKDYVMRLIGLPSDSIEIRDGKLIINGEFYESENYYTIPLSHETAHINLDKPVIVIPEGHYFVLGDNSAASLDSRYYGPIPSKNVWARMIFLMK